MTLNIIRTKYCGEVEFCDLKSQIIICGWVHFIRDFGKIIFFTVRDCTGFVQVTADSLNFTNLDFYNISLVRREFVIQVYGFVFLKKDLKKDENIIKNDLIEISASKIIVINDCIPLPFYPDDFHNLSEEIRLKYRYLDLRRKNMQFNLKKRNDVIKLMRFFLYKNNFIEIETPILTKSTPEGARDYVVPSRINVGSFFALPQSPQIFKQLLIIGGVDKYYQVAKCFRDEDLRSDRQPEFTQLDLEMAFVDEFYIISLIEKLIYEIFFNLLNVSVSLPFFKLSYKKSLYYFKSDKPDYRNFFEFKDITNYIYVNYKSNFNDICKNIKYKIFSFVLHNKNYDLSKINLNYYFKFFSENNIKNYVCINIFEKNNENFKLKIFNNSKLSYEIINEIVLHLKSFSGDIVFIIFDEFDLINETLFLFLQMLSLDLIKFNNIWYFSWIIDFPLFTWNFLFNNWISTHHPFSCPKDNYNNFFINNFPGDVLSKSYDLIINGLELGGGSIRINNYQLQEDIFKILGMSVVDINNDFGFLINSLKSGAPIFGGIALGLDRLLMILTKSKSIRDVIAFPKTQSSNCMLTLAPSILNFDQLDILGINIILKY